MAKHCVGVGVCPGATRASNPYLYNRSSFAGSPLGGLPRRAANDLFLCGFSPLLVVSALSDLHKAVWTLPQGSHGCNRLVAQMRQGWKVSYPSSSKDFTSRYCATTDGSSVVK